MQNNKIETGYKEKREKVKPETFSNNSNNLQLSHYRPLSFWLPNLNQETKPLSTVLAFEAKLGVNYSVPQPLPNLTSKEEEMWEDINSYLGIESGQRKSY